MAPHYLINLQDVIFYIEAFEHALILKPKIAGCLVKGVFSACCMETLPVHQCEPALSVECSSMNDLAN